MSKLALSGHTFELAPSFAEGHILSAGEANALNKLAYTRQRLLAQRMLASEQSLLEVQAALSSFAFDDEPFEPPLTPLEREALNVARNVCAVQLGQGVFPSDLEANVRRLAASEGVLREAQRRLEAREKFTKQALDLAI